MTRVFTYGTLLRGEGNHRCIADGTFAGETTTAEPMALIDLGAYPAVVVAAAAEGLPTSHVTGEVFEVDDRTLARLDQLEGYPQLYDRREIDLADGTRALIYVMLHPPHWARPIPEGSWRHRHHGIAI